MKKVVYSVSKVNHRDEKLTGIGYLADGNLLIPAISSKGKPYIRIFENVEERCNPNTLQNATEFKGYITVAYTDVPVQRDNSESKDILDYIEVEYSVWYKYVD